MLYITVQKCTILYYTWLYFASHYYLKYQNGLEACTIIRSLGFTGLIVGVTGNALDDDVANFIKAGADCVFAKPFREEHLAALLQFISENGCESSIKSQTLIKPEQKKYFL